MTITSCFIVALVIASTFSPWTEKGQLLKGYVTKNRIYWLPSVGHTISLDALSGAEVAVAWVNAPAIDPKSNLPASEEIQYFGFCVEGSPQKHFVWRIAESQIWVITGGGMSPNSYVHRLSLDAKPTKSDSEIGRNKYRQNIVADCFPLTSLTLRQQRTSRESAQERRQSLAQNVLIDFAPTSDDSGKLYILDSNQVMTVWNLNLNAIASSSPWHVPTRGKLDLTQTQWTKGEEFETEFHEDFQVFQQESRMFAVTDSGCLYRLHYENGKCIFRKVAGFEPIEVLIDDSRSGKVYAFTKSFAFWLPNFGHAIPHDLRDINIRDYKDPASEYVRDSADILLRAVKFINEKKELNTLFDREMSNPVVQSKLDEIGKYIDRANTADGRNRLLGAVFDLNSTKIDQLELIRELIWHRAHTAPHRAESETMFVVIRLTDVSEYSIVKAIAPLLGHTDDSIVRACKEAAATFEQRSEWDRDFNFIPYISYISEKRTASEELEECLVEYLFERSPQHALSVFLEATMDPDSRKPLLLAKHHIENALWKLKHGFTTEVEAMPVVREQILIFANHQEFWARLYAARMLAQSYKYGTEEVIACLQHDSHPLVKRIANSISLPVDK
jgi:hypothetical protein